MKSKFITLKLGIKKNKTDGLLICLPEESNTNLISTLNKFAAAPVIISKHNIIKSNYEVYKSFKINNISANIFYICIKVISKIFQVKFLELINQKRDLH